MSKRKGSRNEYRTMRLLESVGYVCTKAGGSLGVWDVIGISKTDVVCVQVKSNRWPGSKETQAMKDAPHPANTRKFIHRWNDYSNQPLIRELDPRGELND